MPEVLRPRDQRDICELVAACSPLEVVGGGTKRVVGRRTGARQLSTAALDRIINYDPAELILTVEPGAKLADVETLLAAQNQMLAFEPFDFSEISGVGATASTMGGIVGAGFSGSRRLSAGGVRDHLLGFSAVNGRGEMFKAGGKVVKNVTGYDLSKLVAGSWGRLCVLTELTFKVVPRPEQTRTLALRGLSPAAAVEAMGAAMRSQAEVAAASSANGVTAIRLEGFGPSVAARAQLLERLLSGHGRVETLTDADAHWRAVRSARLIADYSERLPALWRIVAPPAQGAAVTAAAEALGGVSLMDWAGGFIWTQLPNEASSAIRRSAEQSGGHAMLVDASDALLETVPALHPETAAVAALSKRVRESFDPAGVFETGRFP